MNPFEAGFSDEKPIDKPNYELRYKWFIEEFVKYNKEIPKELKLEYNFLKEIVGDKNEDNSLEKILQKYRVKVGDEVPMPEIVLSVCDSMGKNKRMIMTRENISCVTAQAKVGKTFLVKLLVSAVLKRGLFQSRLISELPIGRDRILYIDTEQSKFHVLLGLNQIKQIIGDESINEFERLEVYQFDAVSTMQRKDFVRHLIYERKADFVILDGVSDLALDTNNLQEADELVTNLRIWATENKCHILNVIHQNPNDHQTKMKGHLGTKLMDKSEIVIGVSVDKNNEDIRIVQSLASRNKKPEPFEFVIDENGIPVIENAPVDLHKINGTKPKKADKPNIQIYRMLEAIYAKVKDEVTSYKIGEIKMQVILEFEKMFNESLSETNAKKIIAKAVDNGWLLLGEGKYFLGSYDFDNIDEPF